MKEGIITTFSIFASFLTELLFGGFTIELKVLLIFMLFDIISALICAGRGASKKNETGHISSEAFYTGIAKKLLTLILCSVAHLCDKLLGINYAMNACMYGFIANELISIIENYTLIVDEPPLVFKKILEVLNMKENEE